MLRKKYFIFRFLNRFFKKETKRFGEISEGNYSLDKFFDLSLDMLCIARLDGFVLRINPTFQRAFGWSSEKLMGFGVYTFLHPEHFESTNRVVEDLKRGKPLISFQNRYLCADGTYKHFSWTAFPDLEEGLIYAIARDISESIEANQKINQLAVELKTANCKLFEQASTDPLTQLKNRRAFDEEFDRLIHSLQHKKETLSVLMIDVDHFKSYNDQFGHIEGDQILIEIASLLSKTLKKNDILARYGGEEFIVVLTDNEEQSILTAETLRRTIQDHRWDKRSITISIGIATLGITSDKNKSTKDLINEADKALYESKTKGRNRFTHFRSLVRL